MAADPRDASRHAEQVVRRVLLRRNVAIDAETAHLVVAAVQGVERVGGAGRQGGSGGAPRGPRAGHQQRSELSRGIKVGTDGDAR